MPSDSLYRDDVYAWSKQQAEALRELQRRAPSNGVDWENVIEEVEDVGGNRLNAVESALRLIFVHLIKLASEPRSRSVRHWRREIVAFRGDLLQNYLPSMRQNVDLDGVWRRASVQARDQAAVDGRPGLALPRRCPFELDELLRDALDFERLEARLRPPFAPERR